MKGRKNVLAILMAVMMVFAMTPLGAGVAFADEENGNVVEDAIVNAGDGAADVEQDAVVDDEEAVAEGEDAVVEEEPAEAVGEEEPSVEASGVNVGYYVLDLSNGPVQFAIDFGGSASEPTPEQMETILFLEYFSLFSNQSEECLGYYNLIMDPNDKYVAYLDLDKNGSGDVEMRPIFNGTEKDSDGNEQPKVVGVTFAQASTTSVFGTITFTLPPEYLANLEQGTEFEKYWTGIQFIIKADNTLTLKGKTFKVKAKKLKKKAKKFSIAKVVKVTGAQGAVTYVKKSGNKKIKISKTGKVTLKKKLKKGTYKVKVNVTAAGSDVYKPVTKTVTFKVKVTK